MTKNQKIAFRTALVSLRNEVVPSRAGRPAGQTRDARVTEVVEMLRTGKRRTKAGAEKPVNFATTVKLVLDLCKWGASVRVPSEVVARFPWMNASRDALTAAAESVGVDPAVFIGAVTSGSSPVTTSAPAPVLLDEPADEPEPEIAAAVATRVVAMRARARR